MNTNTVTRFGNMAQAQAVMQGAPNAAPQQAVVPAVMAPAQDVAVFASAPAAPAAAPAIKFEGKLWDATKNLFRKQADNVGATFDLQAAKADAARMLKERELIPQRIEEQERELGIKRAEIVKMADLENGPLAVLQAGANRIKAKLDAAQSELDAQYELLLDNEGVAGKEDLVEGTRDEITSLEAKVQGLEQEYADEMELVDGQKQNVELINLQVEVIDEKIAEGREMLKEAKQAFRKAKMYEKQLTIMDALGVNDEGQIGEALKLSNEAKSFEGEKKAAVERHLGQSVEEAVAERRRKLEHKSRVQEHQNNSRIDQRLEELRAKKAAEAKAKAGEANLEKEQTQQ